MAKKTDYSKQSAADLQETEAKMRKDLFDLQFQHATRKLLNPMEIRLKRRELARVLTAQNKPKSA